MPGFLFDPHVHTCEVSPCGRIPARELVHLYAKAGYQGIVITDHFSDYGLRSVFNESWQKVVAYYRTGYKAARDEAGKAGITVLWGMELTFKSPGKNDYLVYGLDKDFLMEHNNLLDLDILSLRKLTAGMPVLIYQAHPFREGLTRAQPTLIDGVEVYNGNPRQHSFNSRALEFAKQHNLLQIAGSDAHQAEDVGRGGIYLPGLPENEADFVSLLKSNRNITLYKNTLVPID